MTLKSNFMRLFAQDHLFGKAVSMTYAMVQMGVLFIRRPSRELLKQFKAILVIKPNYSMLSPVRLINLYALAKEADHMNLEGDLVECGVWNGGSAAMMAQLKRKVWLFDSFEGLPLPGEKDKGIEAASFVKGLHKGSQEKIIEVFKKLNVDLSSVNIVKGWLEDTLERSGVEKVVLLHIDTDWYASVKYALNFFYDRITPGGFIVVDDYWFFPGCRQAVHDFIKERRLEDKIVIKKVDRSAVYFQKTK